jgi:hypothetical protein
LLCRIVPFPAMLQADLREHLERLNLDPRTDVCVTRRHRPLYRGKPAIISDDYFDEKIVQGIELVENDEYAAFARRIPLPRPPIPRLGRDLRDRGRGSREDVTARAELRALSGSAPPASRGPKRARRTSQHYNSVRIAKNRMIKHSSA